MHEIIPAQVLLALEKEWAVIGPNRLKVVILQTFPQAIIVRL
jgi:hypothetical protein